MQPKKQLKVQYIRILELDGLSSQKLEQYEQSDKTFQCTDQVFNGYSKVGAPPECCQYKNLNS